MLFCQFNTFRPDYPSGTFNFGRAYTQGPDPASASATAGYGLASALLGSPDGGQFTIGPSLALLQTSYNWYLNDDWKITRTFSVSLGVRFEYQTPFKERYNHLAYFDPNATEPVTGLKGVLLTTTSSHRYPSNPNKNWGPRVGLAWTFLPNTVFRAGYGQFFAPGSGGIGSSPGDLGSGSSVATGVYFGQTPAAPNTPVIGASLVNPFVTGLLPYPNSLVGNGIGAIFPSWATPLNHMWNANIQRSLGKNLLVEAAYIGSRGEHIWNNFTSNATFPQYLSLGTQLNNLVDNPFFGKITTGSMSAAKVRYGSLLVPYPQYSGVSQIRAAVGDSIYHGFTLRVERAFSDGLLFQASYTAAKLIDNVNERFLGGANYINPYNLRLSRAISAADDQRYRFGADRHADLYRRSLQFRGSERLWLLCRPPEGRQPAQWTAEHEPVVRHERVRQPRAILLRQWLAHGTGSAQPRIIQFRFRDEPMAAHPRAHAAAIPRRVLQHPEPPEPGWAKHRHYVLDFRADYVEEWQPNHYHGFTTCILSG